MSLSPEEAVGTAVNALVREAIGPLRYYDYVPADGSVKTPFAALGVMGAERRHGSRCARVWEVSFRIHLFSKAAGREDAWRTLQQLREALDGASLALAEPYAADTKLREQRAGDANDRLQAFAHAFIQFSLTVSRPNPDGGPA
jgi:hypothetical protein